MGKALQAEMRKEGKTKNNEKVDNIAEISDNILQNQTKLLNQQNLAKSLTSIRDQDLKNQTKLLNQQNLAKSLTSKHYQEPPKAETQSKESIFDTLIENKTFQK